MTFFKINSIAGTAWPIIPQHSILWSAYQALEQSQWLSSEEIEKMQLVQINALLKHCFESNPYYKLMIGKNGLAGKTINSISDFRKLPILTRKTYQDNFGFLKSVKLPNGMEANKHMTFTSGTNGVPISILKTNRDDLWWHAMAMRDFEWNKMDPNKRIAAIRLIAMTSDDLPKALEGISTPAWLPTSLFQSAPAYALDIRQTPHKQIEWLKSVKPDYLISLPSNLDILASILQETKQTIPGLELIQVIGEPLTPAIRERIELAFQVEVKNLYSANECGYIASSCPSGSGLHAHAETVFTEVLDAKDQPCKPGQTGRLVLTSLTNFMTPFIRYDIIDEVTLADEPCSCGRGLPYWKHVDGRRHPMLFLSNNRRKISTGIMLGVRQIGGVHQFQVIQHNVDNFTIRVVPNHDWTDEHGQQMIKCIQNEVEALVNVDIKKSAIIERPNGKLKIIVVEPENTNGK